MLMKYQEFIVLDLETTGVDSKTDDIIEFAAVKLDASGNIIDQLDFLVSTDQVLSPTIIALTGIRPEDIRDQPAIEELIPQIEQFCGDLPIVGHNIGFDIEFLVAKGCDVKLNPVLDTLELAHTVLPYQDFYRLEHLAKHFNFVHQPAHRAMADVLATVDLFKLLVHHVADLQASTRQQINQLVGEDTWQWQWLFANPLDFGDERFKAVSDTTVTNGLAEDIEQSGEYLSKINDVKSGKVNFIETHFPVSSLGLALSYAVSVKPAVLIVPEKMIKQIDWQSIIAGATVDFYYPAKLTYREGSEVELVESGIPIGALEARIITKIIIFKEEWGRDYAKLYLTREEEYQWEQKFSSLGSETSRADLILVSPTAALDMDVAGREVVIFDPLMMEDAEFRASSRLFSLNYFNAAISSRRDFIHQHIKPIDVKIADTAFKILNQISSSFTKLSEMIISIYRMSPPVSQQERNIELSQDVLDKEFKEEIGNAVENLESYLKLIREIKAPAVPQIAGTEKLIDHLQALKIQRADYRYFLFADDNRFYLELVPAVPKFSNILRIASEARNVTVLSSGLSVAGRFDYWKRYFGEFNSRIIEPAGKTELIVADDASEDSTEALVGAARQLILKKNEKSLILAPSNFEAKSVFTKIFDEAKANGIKLFSNDTAGTITCVPPLLKDGQPAIYISYYAWMHQAVWYAGDFDRIVLGKIPFEAISRPQFRVLGDGWEGFESYTLARAVFRFKVVLHTVSLLQRPISLIDARLYAKDYGRKIIDSLAGFSVIPDKIDSLFD
ncbi:hypothetical protein DRH29_00470 [candidate division Kazan bacterium]|uniref:Exonuclease domain-containing protein n=1 Tax=candidate division Kazan bacterium TaxID=2202143 RepID=A0A420ZDY0_UNCK3|nr:MAG: hypothetical protein DRH29_00470 [candidate division Kazan bacterium]